MATSKTFKRNDTAPSIAITCTSDGSAKDLTGAASAKFLMGTIDGAGVATTKVEGTMSFDADRSTGLTYYEWQTTDLDTAGTYKVEVEITWADGKVQTFPEDSYLEIVVMADVG